MAAIDELVLDVDGARLTGHLARPTRPAMGALPGLVLCHGLPSRDPQLSDSDTYEQLADRVADDVGYVVAAITLRGCGTSEGDFSLGGWTRDIDAAVAHLLDEQAASSVLLVGAATGGSVAICAGAANPAVRGVATLAARADFDDWAAHPRRFLEHARRIGVVRQPGFPPVFDSWAAELRAYRPIDAVRRLGSRDLMLVHGDEDKLVPLADARRLADAHGAAELKTVPGAGHRLRDDPRVLALLIGWLDRLRAELPVR
ncbi:MAG: alpha/beta fold hydrolase [Actinomycetota bacterium]